MEDAADGRVLLLFPVDGGEAGRRRVAVIDDEFEAERGRRSGGAVLDLELEGSVLGEPAEIEVGVAERCQVGAAAQASPGVTSGGLAGMVDL